MTRWLLKPISAEEILLATLALVAATTLYCLFYANLAGRPESAVDGIIWSLVNMVPWLLAFESAKRISCRLGHAIAFAGGLTLSLLLQLMIGGGIDSLGFELVRRIPGLLAVIAVLGLRRMLAPPAMHVPGSAELPLLPAQVDWVSAAGNYVELHSLGRTILHRAPLHAVEVQLRQAGFVRIHRSTLVRRERIARVRPGDVVLRDGTSLRIGKRYRAGLALL